MNTRAASAFETSFHCPRCGAYAHQQWFQLRAVPADPLRRPPPFVSGQRPSIPFIEVVKIREPTDVAAGRVVETLRLSNCHACGTSSVWVGTKLIHPASPARRHLPHKDLSDDLKRDFTEADEIHQRSPRGAAALLRVVIEKLCRQLTQDENSKLDAQIGKLVAKGLDDRVQKMLDIVRVIGNDAVHPGVLDLRDDVETVQALFVLVNEIAEEMIAKPKRLETMFQSLPPTKLDGIEKRNKRAREANPNPTIPLAHGDADGPGE